MEEKTWLDYLTAFGAAATPVFVLVLTGVGWRLRVRIERRLALEDKLRSDRITAYEAIVKPFIILLMTDEAWSADPKQKGTSKGTVAMRMLLSLEYREQGTRLSLVGSDAVVRAYNNLLQYFYQRGENAPPPGEKEGREMMGLLGQFLLEIRRSIGNEETSLNQWEMLEWFLKGARDYQRPSPSEVLRPPAIAPTA